MKETIRDAYDSLHLSEDARERILRDLLSAAEAPGKERPMKRMPLRRTLCIAAVLILCLSFSAYAYTSDLFGLRQLILGKEPVLIPVDSGDGSMVLVESDPVDLLSMQGFTDTPAARACREYEDFLASYDPDGRLLSAVGNNPTGLSERYDEYLCYTQEMADKIEELLDKYDLEPLLGFQDGPAEAVFSACGVSSVCPPSESVQNDAYWGYCYDSGTFQFEGNMILTGEDSPWPYPIDYQFRRSMKNSFDTTLLNIGDADSYQEWNYTTQNGVPLLLAVSPTKALILADRPDSFVIVNILEPIAMENGAEVTLPPEALEAFAETFDFSGIF